MLKFGFVSHLPRCCAVLIAAAALSGSAPAGSDDTQRGSAGLEKLREITARYEIKISGQRPLELKPEPVLRWNAPRMDIRDAAVFLWVRDGRPQAVVGPYVSPAHGGAYIQFHSLSAEPLAGRCDGAEFWTPGKNAITRDLVPDAPTPAESPRGRLAQMRSMAADFSVEATKGPPNNEPGSKWQLRLMPQPVYRYGDSSGPILDGALFALSLGTDPEAFLLLEAQPDAGGEVRWHFAFASWCESELRAEYRGQQVWLRPHLQGWDVAGPYFRLGPYQEPVPLH